MQEAHASTLTPLRLLYRVHNGQSLPIDRLLDTGSATDSDLRSRSDELCSGLFGGYEENGVLTSVRLYSLERVVHLTQQLRRRLPPREELLAQHEWDDAGVAREAVAGAAN